MSENGRDEAPGGAAAGLGAGPGVVLPADGWAPESATEVRELLDGLAAGRIDGERRARSRAGAALAGAVASLARRLRPVVQIARSVAESARRSVARSSRRRSLIEDATVSLDLAEASLEELAHLSERVGDVAAQASVVALDVAGELERDGQVSHDAMAGFADEVRRLADRTDVAVRRLPVVAGRLREAHGALRDRLGALARLAPDEGADAVARGAVELDAALGGAIDVTAPGALSSAVERVAALRRDLAAELAAAASSGLPPAPEVTEHLEAIAALLVAFGGGEEPAR
jgi:hypothetical protein